MSMDYLDPIHSEGMPNLADSAFALDFLLTARNGVRNCAHAIAETASPEARAVLRRQWVIIPFNVSCGQCWYCQHRPTSQCDNSNPHGEAGGYLGYTETFGGYPGGQAEFLRVPYANFTPFKVPEGSEVEDEKLSVIADAMSTAYWTVENAGVKEGDTVIVLGCGPVGLFTQKFCWLKGAERVIAVD